jgi:hypothetical protein
MSKSYFMNPNKDSDKKEWDFAWNMAVPGKDKECLNEQCGEVWQYMGTYYKNGLWLHQFRHRSHPADGNRMVLNVKATQRFSEYLWSEVGD